jgi:hypothetical protein
MSIFKVTSNERTIIIDCIISQMDLIQSLIEEEIKTVEEIENWEPLGSLTITYFNLKGIKEKFENGKICDVTKDEWNLVTTQLDTFIVMQSDNISLENAELQDITNLYDASAALAKIKMYLLLHKSN